MIPEKNNICRDSEKHFFVLGVRISRLNLASACRKVADFISAREKVYICVAPVSTVVSCQEDPAYHKVINSADMVTPDGMPLVWIARSRGYQEVKRTYGPDLMPLVCREGVERKWRHFFYGADEETNRCMVAALQQRFPGIIVAGRYAPPFRELTEAEAADAVGRINDSAADIVWVGLGSPKQDFWIARNRDKLNSPVLIGIGAAFDFLAGTKPQAPRWVRAAGLEWLFRLSCEPGRLWRRYLIGNTKFLFLLLKDFLGFRRIKT